MFFLDLSTEKWVGHKNESRFIENPTWQQIEAAICELDGKTQTLVTLGVDEETYMSIGGSTNGRYIVNVTFNNMTFYNLADRTQSEQTEELVVGGQLGNYPAKLCVDLPTTLLVAQTFARSGELDNSMTWEEDDSLVIAG